MTLEKDELPKHYYNVLADINFELDPPKENLELLGKIFSKSILKQETTKERFVKIPEKVRELYARTGRPTPLQRAKKLEKALNTNCKIFFKREDCNLMGSHKSNTAFAQSYYIAKDGFKKVTTETGAGQWGSALALACSQFGLELDVYQVKCTYAQKPARRTLMKLYGANIFPSPSNNTRIGKKLNKDFPKTSGSLGMAISEAISVAKEREDTVYSLGSVLNHVLMHQTIIGLETKKQLKKISENADVIIGCVGGGSNFAGIALPFVKDKIKNKKIELIAVEPKEVPSMTKGEYIYDYGDTSKQTPMMKMFSLGCEFVPKKIYAGGLRYHGMSPIISALKKNNLVYSVAYDQKECFEAAKLFIETEGLIVAPETSHAIKAVIERAKKNDNKTIVFCLSGHGFLDLGAYEKVLGL